MRETNHKPVSILLVEDDDIDAMSVQRALHKMQLSNPVIRAIDGIEALEILRQGKIEQPFIVLLDLNLPRMSGLELLSVIRDDKTLKNSIIFVLTTSKREEEIAQAYQHNVAGYIVKSSVNQDFDPVLAFLENYWRLVEIPH
ncbi:response regulator [Vibrio rhizosphaerae]|nr:response regulator [Vibrio rhizosphaerae]